MQYEKVAELGSGNGGVVDRVRHKGTQVEMARKMIMMDVKPTIRYHPYITSAYFWTFSDPPTHPTSAKIAIFLTPPTTDKETDVSWDIFQFVI